MGIRGPESRWQLGATKTIRVPVVLADTLLKIARQLDNGVPPESALSQEDKEELGKYSANKL